MSADSLVELVSPFRFEATVERLVEVIQSAGLLIIARVDHSGDAHAAGLEMPPTLVLIYGHPKGGTPIMRIVPAVALDLPLRVLIREVSTSLTVVAFRPVVHMLTASGVPVDTARRLEPAQRLIRTALCA